MGTLALAAGSITDVRSHVYIYVVGSLGGRVVSIYYREDLY